MTALLGLLAPLQAFNAAVGRVGRWAAVVAMTAMVAVTLLQVVCRYVLNNALPWPDEAARFLMLWMTGLVAPAAYRRGGFVAIDMVVRALPARFGAALSLGLLVLSGLVLAWGVKLGHAHTMSGCLFKSASLWVPVDLRLAVPLPGTGLSLTLCTREAAAFAIGFGWVKLPLAAMYAALFAAMVLLSLVNLELILRSLVTLAGGGGRLATIPQDVVEAE